MNNKIISITTAHRSSQNPSHRIAQLDAELDTYRQELKTLPSWDWQEQEEIYKRMDVLIAELTYLREDYEEFEKSLSKLTHENNIVPLRGNNH